MQTQIEPKARELVPASEENRIARTVLLWLNECPLLPDGAIRYEALETGKPNMALHLAQGGYKTKEFIFGGYQAQLRFNLVYRVQPGASGNKRLRADEALDAIGDWASEPGHLPMLGEITRALRVAVEKRAAVSVAWNDGDEDHTITLNLTYEVI